MAQDEDARAGGVEQGILAEVPGQLTNLIGGQPIGSFHARGERQPHVNLV